jgi:hypothetical protein
MASSDYYNLEMFIKRLHERWFEPQTVEGIPLL